MSIQERLKMVMKMNNLSAAAFADRVGVQRSSISHIMSGRNKPSLDFIQKTLKSFPRVNGDWLVTGRAVGTNSDTNTDFSHNEDKTDQQEKRESITEQTDTGKSNELRKQEEREIERIVVLYSDGTYAETIPKG
jgi:transcriptional regulator with XRE-family HTH domain